MKQHLNTSMHLKRLQNNQVVQQQLLQQQSGCYFGEMKNQYHRELSDAFLAADIPISKLANPVLSEFLKKYTGFETPTPQEIQRMRDNMCITNSVTEVDDSNDAEGV